MEENKGVLNLVLKKSKLKASKSMFLDTLIGNVSYKGLKHSREKDIFSLLRKLKKQKGIKSGPFLKGIFSIAGPQVYLRKKKVGGSKYTIPVFVDYEQSCRFVIKWVTSLTCGRKAGSLQKKLGKELLLITKRKGRVMARKRKLYKKAISARAFIKYL